MRSIRNPQIVRQFQRSLASRVLGDRQEVVVRILEPGYPRAARRTPDPGRILFQPWVPFQRDTMLSKARDDVCDIAHLPAQRREGLWGEAFHLLQSQLDTVRIQADTNASLERIANPNTLL